MIQRHAEVPPAATDGDLLARIYAKDVKALEELYDRYGGYVLGLAIRIVKEREEAEEIVQDVFWELWKGRIRYEPERGRFSTWLHTMARNRSIDRLRRRGISARSEGLDDDLETDEGEDPESLAQRAERRSQVQQALEQLPEEQRQALALCFYEGLTHREVSQRLQTPLGTVKSRIRAAIAKLKSSLEGLQ